ncbi:MAG: hypothetical protein NTX05_07455 [Fusobacteria bacterium]|nr:hypothetical protein [Fusobacteriota bacterium]
MIRMVVVEDDEQYRHLLERRLTEIAEKNQWKIKLEVFDSYYAFFDYYVMNQQIIDFIITDHFLGNNAYENGINLTVNVLTEREIPVLLITGKEDFGLICSELYERIPQENHQFIGYLHKSYIDSDHFEDKILKYLNRSSEEIAIKQYGVGKSKVDIDVNHINYIEVRPNSREHKIVFSLDYDGEESIVVSRKISEELREKYVFTMRIKLAEKIYYLRNDSVKKMMVSYVLFNDNSILK